MNKRVKAGIRNVSNGRKRLASGIWILILILLAAGLISALSSAGILKKLTGFFVQEIGVCYCSSCNDCNSALNDENCQEVRLTSDVSVFQVKGKNASCINNPIGFNNKVLDCQGYEARGVKGSDYFIYLKKKSGNTIKNCSVQNFTYGIFLDSSSNNRILYNTVYRSLKDGIMLRNSNNNTLISNILSINQLNGITISSSDNNVLSNNRISNNNKNGIGFSAGSNGNILELNTINDNKGDGIYLASGTNNKIKKQIIFNNKNGIKIASSNNEFSNLNIINNSEIGLYITGTGNKFSDLRACYNKGKRLEKKGLVQDIYNGKRGNDFGINFCNNSYEANCNYPCIDNEQGLCNDNLDNDGDFLTDCQDASDCPSSCSGNCVVATCNNDDYDWSCQANQSSCSTCYECQQGAGFNFNCQPLTISNFGSCSEVGSSCLAGLCQNRQKCDASECSGGFVLNNTGGICVNATSLCGDGVCDSSGGCGENSTTCLKDCPECTSNSDCEDSYSEWLYSARGFTEIDFNYLFRERTYSQAFCNTSLGTCASNAIMQQENISRWGDSDYCSKKKNLAGENCSWSEFDCDRNSECGVDSNNYPLVCMRNSVSRSLFADMRDASPFYYDGCCREDEEEWYIAPVGEPEMRGCIQKYYETKCYRGEVWWFNEIGRRKELEDTCQAGETCYNGACIPVTCSLDSQCNDNKACTADRCVEPDTPDARCENSIIQGKCLIDGSCYNNLELDDDGCGKCSSSINQTTWTALNQEEACSDNRCDVVCGYDCGGCDDDNSCTLDLCGNDKYCAFPTISKTQACTNRECGPDVNDCGFNCGTCLTGYNCNSTGSCVQLDNCTTLGFECGMQVIDNQQVNCGTCPGGKACNENIGRCEDLKNQISFIVHNQNPIISLFQQSNIINPVSGNTFSISSNVVDSGIRIEQVTSAGSLIFSNSHFVNNTIVTSQFLDVYAGNQPSGMNILSLLSVEYNSNKFNFSVADVVLKGVLLTGGNICKCQNWNFNTRNCDSLWACNNASTYSGFGSNSTHYWFKVNEFSAYAGANLLCSPGWQCAEWSNCTNNQQLRTCNDLNNCGITTGKPIESQACSTCTDSCSSLNKSCGVWNICGVQTKCPASGEDCASNQYCDTTAKCVNVTGLCPTCQSLNYSCGLWSICGNTTNCGNCNAGFTCVTSSAGTSCVNASTICNENWLCSDWGTCTNSQQTRSCNDLNNCGTVTSRPALVKSCTSAGVSGACGDGTCQSSESYTTCPQDCECEERWSCGRWSSCIDGEQERTCTDLNNCGTEEFMPSEIQGCEEEEEEEAPTATAKVSSTVWIVLISLLGAAIIVVIIIIIVIQRRKAKEEAGMA